jgi:hypothetical protein
MECDLREDSNRGGVDGIIEIAPLETRESGGKIKIAYGGDICAKNRSFVTYLSLRNDV